MVPGKTFQKQRRTFLPKGRKARCHKKSAQLPKPRARAGRAEEEEECPPPAKQQQVERRDAAHDQTTWSKVVGQREKAAAKKREATQQRTSSKTPGKGQGKQKRKRARKTPKTSVIVVLCPQRDHACAIAEATGRFGLDKVCLEQGVLTSCLLRGHIKELCPISVNHGDRCYRCSVPGHNSRSCQASPNYPFCSNLGRPAGHCLGASKYAQARKERIGRQQKERKNTSPPVVAPAELQPIGGCSGVVQKRQGDKTPHPLLQPNLQFSSTTSTTPEKHRARKPRWALKKLENAFMASVKVACWNQQQEPGKDFDPLQGAVWIRSTLTAVCNVAMRLVKSRRAVHWWTDEIAELRRQA
ncbi:hypothetical protein KM043_016621 [Ampulex compressa]|nr:hypothetical protein KM043_016621 [Ampulex compressa]